MPIDPTLPFASSSDEPRIEPEYADVYQAYVNKPTPQSRSDLLRAVNPVIDTAVRTYGGASAKSPNLRSQARQLALRSFQSYDPSRASLRTHLMSQMRGLQRIGAQQAQIIGVPEGVALDKQHLDEAERELEAHIGRAPSDQQLANYTGLSLKRIAHIRQARPTIASGSVLQEDDEGNVEMPMSQIPGVNPGVEGWEQLVYHDLSDIDQAIFDHMMGRNGRQRLGGTEIAKKLGITPSAVSQRAAKIQKMLDEQYELGVF